MVEDGLDHLGSLREVSSYLSTLGFEVIADVDTVAQDGESIDGYVINPNGLEISVLTKTGRPWFEFSHDFDIRGMFLQSNRLEEINQSREFQTEEALREEIESDPIFNLKDVTHEDFLSRARPVWNSLDEPDRLEYSMVGRLSSDTNDFSCIKKKMG